MFVPLMTDEIVRMADGLYELSTEHDVRSLATSKFDRRVVLSLESAASCIRTSAEEPITVARLREFANRGLVPLLYGADGDTNVQGVPCYAIDRLNLYLQLLATGFTEEELRAHAVYEETVIDDVLTTDELEYVDDDFELLLRHARSRLATEKATLSALEGRPTPGGYLQIPGDTLEAASARVESARRSVTTMQWVDPSRLTAKARRIVGRDAHRLRFFHEFVRVALIADEWERMRAGYSFFVAFNRTRLTAEKAEFEGIRWRETLMASWRADDEPALPIRVPGFVCKGDNVRPMRTLEPLEYASLWAASNLDEYRETVRMLWSERACQRCGGALRPEQKLYCSGKCGAAARQARIRERRPDAVKQAQLKWRSS